MIKISLGAIWMILIVAWLIAYSLGFGFRDDTDSKATRKRSGLSLYVDYGTGVQYVRAGLFGGLSVRVDKDGKPMTVEAQ